MFATKKIFIALKLKNPKELSNEIKNNRSQKMKRIVNGNNQESCVACTNRENWKQFICAHQKI